MVTDLARPWSPSTALGVVLLSVVVVGGLYVYEHNVGLDVADEGWLWYGAWRTLLGEIPLRDFDSYDPARYYWAAAWLRLFGNDIAILRLSGAVLHAAALVASLALLRRATRNPWLLAAAAVVMACWLFPRHRPFEPTIAIFGAYAATLVIESPTARRVFLAGVFVGAAAFVGRNHGVYLTVAFLALLARLRVRDGVRTLVGSLAAFGGGGVVGYAPMLAMLAFVPGFGRAFAASFHAQLRNDPLPLWWTWQELASGVPLVRQVKAASLGILHLLAFAMCAYLFVCLVRTAKKSAPTLPVIAGSAVVGAVYLHYMFFRADIGHFAPAAAALLIGWGALAFAGPDRSRRLLVTIVAVCFVVLTCGSVVLQRPLARYLMGMEGFRSVAIKGRDVMVSPGVARIVSVTEALGSRLPAGDSVLIVPNWPMMYVLLDRKAPIHETYTLVPEQIERQREIIQEMTKGDVRWIIVNDLQSDRWLTQESFQVTHGVVWRHIVEHFEPEPLAGAPKTYVLLRAKGAR